MVSSKKILSFYNILREKRPFIFACVNLSAVAILFLVGYKIDFALFPLFQRMEALLEDQLSSLTPLFYY